MKGIEMRDSVSLFISYRRGDDSKWFSSNINSGLKENFETFYDVAGGIPYGQDFPKVIKESVQKADVLLAVIGKDYAKLFKDKEGSRDFVLEEILEAQASDSLIVPLLMEDAVMPSAKELPKEIAFLSGLNAFEVRHNKLESDLNLLITYLKKIKPQPKQQTSELKRNFGDEVIEILEQKGLVVLFSQDFTDIDAYFEQIKSVAQKRFQNAFYSISIPSFIDDEHRYVCSIAKDCGIECELTKLQDWKQAMRERLLASKEPLLLFITDIENGNEALDRNFSSLLRNFKTEFSHFHALLIGRKALAKLVHAQGDLSPLNLATQIFFPDRDQKLGEERIVQQFERINKHQKRLCKLLQQDKLGRFVVWSNNKLKNQLFWKNLLVKKGKYFEWRGDLTKELGREVLECESN